VTSHAKEILNEAVHRQESLRVSGGFEPPHFRTSPTLSLRHMREHQFSEQRACGPPGPRPTAQGTMLLGIGYVGKDSECQRAEQPSDEGDGESQLRARGD